MSNTKRGFTLIELLVVIAIIGVLASVVLASLNTARAKGADAAIKSNLNGVRAQAELQYDSVSPPVYEGVCENAQIVNQKDAAISAGGTSYVCADSDTAWGMRLALKTNTSLYYCIDSTGTATTTAVNDLVADTDLTCAND